MKAKNGAGAVGACFAKRADLTSVACQLAGAPVPRGSAREAFQMQGSQAVNEVIRGEKNTELDARKAQH
jgi:hypothetical protein